MAAAGSTIPARAWSGGGGVMSDGGNKSQHQPTGKSSASAWQNILQNKLQQKQNFHIPFN
jgi:hypothetical protein